jgi:acetylglutamate kinase
MKLYIIKIGGNVIDDSESLHHFLQDFTALSGYKILIHGGGKMATQLSDDLSIETKMVNGRRITDIETLRIVTMVYAGLINKNIVAQLQFRNCNAIGLTGADGNTVCSKKRPVKDIDYGFVGDIDETSVNIPAIKKLLEDGFVPVFAPLTHDGTGQLLNTNADTIASALAVALSAEYETSLIYCFEKRGVLRDVNDEFSVISLISLSDMENLTSQNIIAGGMLPKIHNAFEAINKGVKEVIIGKADELSQLNHKNSFGTKLVS